MTPKLSNLKKKNLFIISWLLELSGLSRWFSNLSWVIISAGLESFHYIWQLRLTVVWGLSTWLVIFPSMMARFKNERPKRTRWKLGGLLKWPSPRSHIGSFNYVLVTDSYRFEEGVSVSCCKKNALWEILLQLSWKIQFANDLSMSLRVSLFFLAAAVFHCTDYV